MTIPPSDDRVDAAPQGLERAIRVVPYVLLAVATLIASMAGDLIEHRSAAYRLGTLGVAAVTAGWMLWWVTCTRPGSAGAGSWVCTAPACSC